MRTILVPTDFSDTARNAVDYAMQVALKIYAKVIIFHSYDRSDSLPEEEVIMKLEALRRELILNYPHTLEVESVYKTGKLSDNIESVVKEKNVDLVIMGTNGVSKVFSIPVGSNASAVVAASHYPVLIVPPSSTYKGTSRLILAVDHQMDFLEIPIAAIRKLHDMLGGDIFILSVVGNSVDNVPEAVMNILKLDTLFKDIPHSFHYIYNEDVQKGINDFADMQYADLIITLPKKHSWAGRLFGRSYTRDMIHYIKTPVLALQD